MDTQPLLLLQRERQYFLALDTVCLSTSTHAHRIVSIGDLLATSDDLETRKTRSAHLFQEGDSIGSLCSICDRDIVRTDRERQSKVQLYCVYVACVHEKKEEVKGKCGERGGQNESLLNDAEHGKLLAAETERERVSQSERKEAM